jgi:DNA polymerase III delta subunit
MIAIILGPDAATCRTETKRLASELDPDGSNTSRLDGKVARIAEIASMAGTPSFFGSGRVVIVDDLLGKFSRGTSDEPFEDSTRASKNTSSTSELATLVASVHPDNLLILVEQSHATIPASISKALPKDVQVRVSEPPRGNALVEWMQGLATSIGSGIDREAAQALAEGLYPQTWLAKPPNPRYDRPPNLDQLESEIAKLALFVHPDEISTSHVREMAETSTADRLFQFVEQSIAGNLANATRDLESFDLHSDEAHRVSNQIYQQLELSAVLGSAPPKNDPAAVGRELGLSNPNRMFGVARAPRPAFPTESILFANEVDRGIKTGRIKDVGDSIYSLMTWFAEAKQEKATRRGSS